MSSDANQKAQALLPRWRSHKTVDADKITDIRRGIDTCELILRCGCVVTLPNKAHDRMHESSGPGGMVGGYYVRYSDGYESWSPAKAFEDGYARI